MSFSLNNFIVIVGVLLVNSAICIDDNEIIEYDENDKIYLNDDFDEDDVTPELVYFSEYIFENGCEFLPLKSRRGYSYTCGDRRSGLSSGKFIIINNGTDQEEIIYQGYCDTEPSYRSTDYGLEVNYCHYNYTANKDNIHLKGPFAFYIPPPGPTLPPSPGTAQTIPIVEPQLFPEQPSPIDVNIDPKCLLSCIGK